MTFSTDDERFGETVTIDLKPNGRNIEVTNENKKEYIEYVGPCPRLSLDTVADMGSLITEWRIQKRVEEQFNAFVFGFNELIPPDLVNVFDERELELLIGGIADIDVEDWKKHTDYRGYTEQDEVIKNFWAVCIWFFWCYNDLADCGAVYSKLGRRAKVPIAPVRNRDFAYPCQRFQGSAR